MSLVVKTCAAALFLSLGALTAFAQTPAQSGCTPQEQSNLALQNSDKPNAGVICPPDIDPAMKAPAPKTGDNSVIPPPNPGTSDVQPK
jgi:hypothetical protein